MFCANPQMLDLCTPQFTYFLLNYKLTKPAGFTFSGKSQKANQI